MLLRAATTRVSRSPGPLEDSATADFRWADPPDWPVASGTWSSGCRVALKVTAGVIGLATYEDFPCIAWRKYWIRPGSRATASSPALEDPDWPCVVRSIGLPAWYPAVVRLIVLATDWPSETMARIRMMKIKICYFFSLRFNSLSRYFTHRRKHKKKFHIFS